MALRGSVALRSLQRTSSSTRRPVAFAATKRTRVLLAAAAPAGAQLADDDTWGSVEEIVNQVIFECEGPGEDFTLEDDEEALIEEAMQLADVVNPTPVEISAALAVQHMEEDEDEDGSTSKAQAAAVVEALTLSKLWGKGGELTQEELAELAAVGDDLEEVELEDIVLPSGADKFIDPPLTMEEQDLVAPYKLSKSELRNLVPEDWDKINIDFFANKKEQDVPLPEYRLTLMWSVKDLGVAVDQVYSRGQVSPLTQFYFWPRADAWDELKTQLEAQPWFAERDKVLLLNRLTQVINYWQDEQVKHSVEEARSSFPDCHFISA